MKSTANLDGQQSSSGRTSGTRPPSQPLSNAEVERYLRETILPELNLEDATLPEAIRAINDALPRPAAGRKSPRILLAENWQYTGPKIREMKLRNVPLGIALKYVGDATRCRFWIYRGTVVIDVWRDDDIEVYEQFLDQPIDELKIDDANLLEALEVLQVRAQDVDVYGRKPTIMLGGSDEIRSAILRGEVGERVRGLNLQHMKIREALDAICGVSGARYQYFEGEILVLPKEAE